MSDAYDQYDYPRYWRNRDYEHQSEVIVIENFLKKLPHRKHIADVGCGFGRLAPHYSQYTDKITLVDPSGKLLNIAKDKCEADKKFHFKKSTVESVDKKLAKESVDTVIMVRVLHHVEDLDKAFEAINKILKPNGYLILEFANKMHGKALFANLMKGNFTFPFELGPLDRRSKKNQKNNAITFLNHHPDVVKEKLQDNGFKILKTRSVSNFRAKLFKNNVPNILLLGMEKIVQKPLSRFNFGPSVFVLAKKK